MTGDEREKSLVRRGYDRLTAEYASDREDTPLEFAAVESFLETLSPGSRVLDAGCGQGEPILTAWGEHRDEDGDENTPPAVGLDLSRGQLEVAHRNAPESALFQGDMTHLPFAPETFDAVTALHSLIHVPADEHQAVLTEFARVLEPGGDVFLTEGCSEWTGTNPDWLDSDVEMRWQMVGPERTREHLERAGFEVYETGEVDSGLTDDEARFSYFHARVE